MPGFAGLCLPLGNVALAPFFSPFVQRHPNHFSHHHYHLRLTPETTTTAGRYTCGPAIANLVPDIDDRSTEEPAAELTCPRSDLRDLRSCVVCPGWGSLVSARFGAACRRKRSLVLVTQEGRPHTC